jgi:predicted esterase YcpF (UPF0227 family)
MPGLIYVHGFNSSPQSIKARLLGEHLATLENAPTYEVPALPPSPAEAILLLETALRRHRPEARTLVGSSLGGYYATWLAERHGCRAVLINPTTRPFDDLDAYLGRQRNLYSGEEYELTRAHLAELAALRVERLADPGRYLLMVETGDEVLDYRLAVAFYRGAWQYVRGGGDHGFQGFADQIPAVLAFAGWRGGRIAPAARDG